MSVLKTTPLGPGNDAPKSIINQVMGLPAGIEANSKEHVEWLMRERVEVISPWPGMPYGWKAGLVLHVEKQIGRYRYYYRYYVENYSEIGGAETKYSELPIHENFPHLFRRKEWYEDRSPKEMPGYVKNKNGVVVAIEVYDFKNDVILPKGVNFPYKLTSSLAEALPATLAEYEKRGANDLQISRGQVH